MILNKDGPRVLARSFDRISVQRVVEILIGNSAMPDRGRTSAGRAPRPLFTGRARSPVVDMAYTRAGNGSPVMLIAGLSGNGRGWGEQIEQELKQAFDLHCSPTSTATA